MAGRLELAEDIEFQRKTWIFERIGWAAFGVVVAGAALGIFGHGPLARTISTVQGGGLIVEYPRFARMQSPINLEVTLPAGSSPAAGLRIWMSSDYLRNIEIESITPQPDSTELGDGRIAFIFSRAGGARASVSFLLEARLPGTSHGEIGLGSGDSPAVHISHFFYP